MNLTLRQLRAFVAVARLGRFNLAAERLHVTQSALSMLIRELERQLGLRLFDRHTRMVRLTEAGRELLPVAEKTLADLETAVSASRELATLRRGRVSVATSTVLAGTLLPWAIREFTARFPGIRCVLKDCAEQEIRDRVRVGDVDLGVGTALDPDPELAEAPLLEDSITLLCGERHPLGAKRTVAWRELAEQPLIVLGAGSPLRVIVDRALADAGVRVEPAYEVSFSSTVISMTAAGLGVAALPLNARQVSPRVKVLARPLVRPAVKRRIVMFMRREVQLAPAAASFLEFAREYVRAGGYPGSAFAENVSRA
ncbi:MAG TPA: LysR family transcriptional regulator [Burkholderiales bacterium]|nr:LysR family transcriptional regulator [Burkholderiales bacterium]